MIYRKRLGILVSKGQKNDNPSIYNRNSNPILRPDILPSRGTPHRKPDCYIQPVFPYRRRGFSVKPRCYHRTALLSRG